MVTSAKFLKPLKQKSKDSQIDYSTGKLKIFSFKTTDMASKIQNGAGGRKRPTLVELSIKENEKGILHPKVVNEVQWYLS